MGKKKLLQVVTMVTAQEISVNVAIVTVISELGGFFIHKEKHKNSTEGELCSLCSRLS